MPCRAELFKVFALRPLAAEFLQRLRMLQEAGCLHTGCDHKGNRHHGTGADIDIWQDSAPGVEEGWVVALCAADANTVG